MSEQEDSEATAPGAGAGPAANGTLREIDGKPCIHYDGYWIRHYPPPRDTVEARKRLIEHLSRRLFHHAEPGINTPGEHLEKAREAYQREHDPARKRVNAAMLAGALFNRASDIFRSMLDLQQHGVSISPGNELMRQCGEHYQEALELGTMVRHYSGQEGIDELWGEPFKAFTMSIAEFYASRYIKIAQAMRSIDQVAGMLGSTLAQEPGFAQVEARVRELAQAAKLVSETIRRDPVIFTVWPRFVAACEALIATRPRLLPDASSAALERAGAGRRLLKDGTALITYLAGARTPMPESSREFALACKRFRRSR